MTTYKEVMNSSRNHFAARRRHARAPAAAPAASYFDFGFYFCCAPQQPDYAGAAPGDVEAVLEVDVSPRRPARSIDIVATADDDELVWQRLAPPTRDERRPHEASVDVDDAPSSPPPSPPPRPPASPARSPGAAARRAGLRPRRATIKQPPASNTS